MKNVDEIWPFVLEREGGYTNNPKDPGGPTKYGVTLKTLQAYREDDSLTANDVKALTEEEAKNIFLVNYMQPLHADDDSMHVSVALMISDCAYNSGVRRAVQLAQHVLGLDEDGVLGPMTHRELLHAAPVMFVRDYKSARIDFLRTLNTWPIFGKGWEARVSVCAAKAVILL